MSRISSQEGVSSTSLFSLDTAPPVLGTVGEFLISTILSLGSLRLIFTFFHFSNQ